MMPLLISASGVPIEVLVEENYFLEGYFSHRLQ